MLTPVKKSDSHTADDIARVAVALFAEYGYDATSVRMIAEAAGVTCPTLYYHFGSKEGLARAVLLAPLSQVTGTLQSLLDRSMDPVARLVQAVHAYFEFSREDPHRARFIYAVMFGPLDRSLATRLDEHIRRNNELLRQIASSLADEGLVPPALVGELILALRGQIVIRTMDFLYRGGALGPRVSAQVVARVFEGHLSPGISLARRRTTKSASARQAKEFSRP